MTLTVYAPNLAQRPERKVSISEQFAGRSEFNLHIVPAIEKRHPTWGLWQTFYNIVCTEKEKGSKLFVFCEDDHIFTAQYNKDLLFECIREADRLEAEILSGGMAVARNPVQISKNLFWVDWFNGMQFTVIYSRMYDRILAAKTTKGYTLDEMLSHLSKNKLVIYPYISVQKEFGYSDATDINNEQGRVTRFFKNTQTSLSRLSQTRSFYSRISQSAVDSVMSTDVSNFYVPTFVINMKERTDRLHHIKNEFAGRNEFQLNIVEACKDECGALGLWKSVCKILSYAKEHDEDYILICEDDHQFLPNYDKHLFLHQIMLAGSMGAELLNGGVGGFGNLIPLNNGLYWVDSFWCTQFIVIFKRAYDIILNTHFGIRDVADEKLSEILTSKMVIGPFISEQTDFGYSDVTSSNNEYATILRHFEESKQKFRYYQYVEMRVRGGHSYDSYINTVDHYLTNNKVNKLQLGCGNNLLSGWLNTDFHPTYGAVFLDVMQKFPMPDGCIDFIFAEHLIELFSFKHASTILKECNRVLKHGGVLRLTMLSPENIISMMTYSTIDAVTLKYIQWVIRNYDKSNELDAKSQPIEIQKSIAYSAFYSKMSEIVAYTYVAIKYLLENSGFSNVRKLSIAESDYAALRGIERHKAFVSSDIYQFETLTVEATKC